MSTSVRSDSFQVVGEQVAATLQDAHAALESYAEGDAGPKGLLVCADFLHAARGALQITEVYGASLLAEEMELACKYLASLRAGKGREDGVDLLRTADGREVQAPAELRRAASLAAGPQRSALEGWARRLEGDLPGAIERLEAALADGLQPLYQLWSEHQLGLARAGSTSPERGWSGMEPPQE